MTDDLDSLRDQAIQEATSLFEGDEEATGRWLSKPVRGLGKRTPSEMLESREGIQQVSTLIGRLEHGIT